jgi:hypothetical protein
MCLYVGISGFWNPWGVFLVTFFAYTTNEIKLVK